MKYLSNIPEEELKNKVAADYFAKYDSTRIIGKIDFCIANKNKEESLFWAEAKKGECDIYKSLTQLILTIGKAKTFNAHLPPKYLGAFDSKKIVFIPYEQIQEIFYLNDFNWKVTSSNQQTKEFKFVLAKTQSVIAKNSLLFDFAKDDGELKKFIQSNFSRDSETSKIQIDKNNFVNVYNRWLEIVKPSIGLDWELAKEKKILDADFYLADLLSLKNDTQEIADKLYVLLSHDYYLLERKIDEMGMFDSKKAYFKDEQKAHREFWHKYERPPRREYWDYLIERRDLLVPQDIRERKGSFYTPKIWVDLSQQYLAAALGEDWQEEYTIWDCAAGTGNLLVGLKNKYNIWASTIDQQDVDVMQERIKNGANLLAEHVFQFDFLNDDFSKLPKPLQAILNDPEQRKKLVIYINPPYAEVSSVFAKGKKGVNQSKIHDQYLSKIGTAGRELYIMFLCRIYEELSGCFVGEFSTLKVFQGSAFDKFRSFFQSKLEKIFIVPADTFDNVKGKFPIGFKIWNTNKKKLFSKISSDIFNERGNYIGEKTLFIIDKDNFINKWISKYKFTKENYIAFLAGTNSNDFQQNSIVYILNKKEQMSNPRGVWISDLNLIPVSIYFSVRKVIPATWLNDRDQFLYPNEGWKTDREFQNNCLAYTLFHSSNNIQSQHGINHWIPFTEEEIQAKEKFQSSFMKDFMTGKLTVSPQKDEQSEMNFKKSKKRTALIFSAAAQDVFTAGRELWEYYHEECYKYNSQKYNVNASFYEIREYFQGRNEAGKMKNKSDDQKYMELLRKLREQLKILGEEILPKIYQYGFLKE